MDERAISFGSFRLLPSQRLLLEGNQPVRLGSRALDILTVLAENAGRVVPKEELIARVWPGIFVQESNLKIQVSALRRAVGDGQGGNRYIVTVPGRGYEFVVPVGLTAELAAIPAPAVPQPGTHNLPLAMTRIIGREDSVATLVSRLSRERLLTIVGPGGIGKTTVALAVAEGIIADYEDGVWLVDLAPLSDPRLVPSTVATVLGLEIHTENPLPGLIAALGDRRMLLLLDNCEHVIDAAASLAAAVLTGVPRVNILATSREPLGVAGERAHRLGPLGSPPTSSGLTATEAEAFPAVQLFVERVTQIIEDFALTDANAAPVVEICRRLDGLPLAIEFAAPRVEVLGVEGLAAGLDRRLPLLTAGHRMAMPRHRTMRAVLDWSYGLLSEDEQRFLRALGIFAGDFTVEAATAVALEPATTRIEPIDRLADLVAKSLVVADVGEAKPRFRLLDTTRAYAIEKLDESGDRKRVARRHSEHYRNLFERAEGEAAARSTDEWLAEYAREIDNLRVALDWTFSPGGDESIGVALTAAAVPLWMRLSLLAECGSRVTQALDAPGTAGAADPRNDMKLHAALGASMQDAAKMGVAFAKALDIAESVGDIEYQLRALCGLYYYHTGSSRYSAALPFAQKFYDLATSGPDPSERLFGERMMGVAKHFLGDHNGARRHLERVLTGYVATDHRPDVIRFQIDLRVSAYGFLARVLWFQGYADQAMRAAETSIAEALATGHALSLSHALANAACPIALWTGNLDAAKHYTEMLLAQSKQHSVFHWDGFGARFRAILVLKGTDLDTGSRLPHSHDDDYVGRNLNFPFLTGLTELAEALSDVGRTTEALALLERVEPSEAGWLTPELLRVKGALLLSQHTPAVPEAVEDLFRRALDGAREQQMLSWELRAATSLARLLRNQDRPADAIACLRPAYDRFTEGFGTADLTAAKQLLNELSHGHQQRPASDS